ncbi:Protein containing DUF1566 [Candidatus Magnetomoraceae bacterium gMMP-15]
MFKKIIFLFILLCGILLYAGVYSEKIPHFQTTADGIIKVLSVPNFSQGINLQIEFNSGSYEILKNSYAVLNELGKALTSDTLKNYAFIIKGHTDSDGDASSNKKLSLNRAFSVKLYLRQHFSIPSWRLEVVGMGEEVPLISNTTKANKKLNRRVEVVLSKASQPVQARKVQKDKEVVTPESLQSSDYLSDSDVKKMLIKNTFYSKSYVWNENISNDKGNFINNFKKAKNGTIIDKKTKLMWQQAGSPGYMSWEGAKGYIHALNKKGFAGYNDWRLPTIKELASLIENKKKNNDLYIDSIFSNTQRWCWSRNTRGTTLAWVAYFNYGHVYYSFTANFNYVKAVRSLP